MTIEVLDEPAVPAATTPARRWTGLALLGILVLAALLYCWGLGDRSLQPYYAAGVHSMTGNAKAFLFGGYDATGVVSVDKTPFAFWVQGIGVWIFGYHWWAIALVQAIEGVASVFVLHRVVRRWAGERPALLAALILALSPITTAIERENQADGLLVLLLLLAAYCLTRAVQQAVAPGQTGGTGWLMAAGALVGLGFFAKMLSAWIVLPAFAIAYLVVPVSWPKRVLRLLSSGAVCAAVSLAWVVFVSLVPAADRPYVGSSTNDSIWELVFGYNGFGRVAGGQTGALSAVAGPDVNQFGGVPGPLRLFGAAFADQIGWLLPLALITVIGAVVVWARTRGGDVTQRAGWLLWGGWLVVATLVFSFAGGLLHRYYTVELAPAVAAVSAVGLTWCWRWYRAGRRAGLLLPLAVLGTVAFAFHALRHTPDWLPWLRVVIVVAGVLCAAVLLAAFPGRRMAKLTPAVALLAVITMLAGPFAFSVDTVLVAQTTATSADPSAGPSTTDLEEVAVRQLGSSVGQLYLNVINRTPYLSAAQREVLDYATAHAPRARIQLAVEWGSWGADPFILNSTARVAGFGGYTGLDPAPTAEQLAGWAKTGQVGFVLLPGSLIELGRAVAARGGVQAGQRRAAVAADPSAFVERFEWFSAHCPRVAPSSIGPGALAAGVLYDCRDAAGR